MEQYTNLIITILTLIASNVTTFFFARRKSKAQAQGTEIDNVEKSLSIYREMLKDLRDELKRQNDTILQQEIEIQKMKIQIIDLRKNKPCK